MYKWVTNKKYLKETYSESANVVNQLVQELKKNGLETKMNVVGSAKRNMITQNAKGKIDFDFNLLVEEAGRYDSRELKEYIRKTFNMVLQRNRWADCQDSTFPLTARPRNYKSRKIPFSIDVCVVMRDRQGNFFRLKHIKTGNIKRDQYIWNSVPDSKDLAIKEDFLKPEYWLEVRETYLDKKKMYLKRNDKDHPSFVCYIEAVNEVYYKYCNTVINRVENS